MNHLIGARIRSIRVRQKLTLQQLGDRVGCTRSLLSKIETGKTMPPVATLSRIAKALGVSTGAILDEPDGANVIFTPADTATERQIETQKGYQFHAFAAGRVDKTMQPYLFTACKGKVKPETLSHSGEEFIYVLNGVLNYTVGNVTYRLGPGDSLYFDAEEPHDLTAESETARYLAIFVDR